MEGLLLAAALLTVYAYAQREIPGQADPASPLRVDTGLKSPLLSQASSLFSLNALFGGYLGMFWLLGSPVVLGLALGTGAALLYLHRHFRRLSTSSFHDYLTLLVEGPRGTPLVALLGLVQLFYFASEFVILRQLLATGFDLPAVAATALTIAIVLVGYFTVVENGYTALFRADFAQAFFVAVMLAALLLSLDIQQVRYRAPLLLQGPSLGYWAFPPMNTAARLLIHVALGAILGFSFLIGSVDCWKRVALVAREQTFGALRLLLVSALPFLVSVPLVLAAQAPVQGPMGLFDALPGIRQHRLALFAVCLGLVSSALSAVNGSLLTTAHLIVCHTRAPENERSRYYVALGGVLTLGAAGFIFFVSLGNAYLLGNLLLAPFAIIGGLFVGTRAFTRQLPSDVFLLTVGGATSAWVLYVCRDPRTMQVASTDQVATFPLGLLCFPVFALLGRALGRERT